MTEREPGEPTAQHLARRTFLRGAVGASGVALVSLLAACGGQAGVTTGSASTGTVSAGSTSASSAAPASTSASSAAPASTSASSSLAPSSSASMSTGSSSLMSSAMTSSATSSASSASAAASTAASSASGSSTAAAVSRTDIKAMADNQTFRVNLGGEPDKLDPNLAEFTNEIAVVRQMFTTLVLLDKDLKPVPGAAESWTTSSDGLTWTFKIRSHKYSDGTPVKAQDFEFSFKRILDPTVAAPYASYFSGVIKGSDAYNSAVVSPPKSGATGLNPVMGTAIIGQAATTTSSGSTTASGTESMSSSASGTESMSMSSSASGTMAASTSTASTMAASSAASTMAASSATTAAATTAAASTAAAPAAKATVTPDQLKALRDAVGVKATDDSTLVITLEQPAGFLLDLVSLSVVPPLRQDLVAEGWTNDLKKYVGNGPFVMIEHQPQDHMLFAPNPNYFEGAPKIGLRYRIITDPNAAFAAYRNGELDLVQPPATNYPNIKADPTLSKEVSITPQLSVYWLQYEVKHPPLNNVKFRQALSQAFDRNAYVADQFKGLAQPAAYFIPKGMPGYDATQGADFAFDATKAKASMQAAGVNPADAGKLNILFTDSPINNQRMSYVQAMLKKSLGIEVKLKPQESKSRVAAQKAKQFDMVLTGWGADYPDPQDWYDIFRTGDGNNQGEYSNPQFDKLVKQADGESDATKRMDLYSQAGKLMLNDQPSLNMYQSVEFALVKPYVQNFTPTAQDDELAGDYFFKIVTLGQH